MTRHYEKFVFLAVLITAIFFARALYPNLSGVPPLANAGQAQQSGAPQQPTVTAAPMLVLPQTTVTAAAPPDGDGSDVAVGTGSNAIPPAGAAPLPTFTSSAYLVADLATGDIAAGSNIANRWPTASLTKLMTATLVLDQLSPTTTITITPQMFAVDPDEYTLVIGGMYTVEDLLHLMLMPSSNVAAEAMAEYIGHAQFMNEMNARATQWGMTSTYFADPSGISATNESSPKDLLALTQHIYAQYPQILALTNTPTWTITELNSGRKTVVKSINNFAGASGFVGGKTGNTPQAGYNLLSVFDDNGTPVLITVLGAPALPFKDTTMLYSWYRTTYH